MQTLIFTGGNHAEENIIKKYATDYKHIIAADSGLDAVNKFKLIPNYIIGDMDSLKDNRLLAKYKNAKIETHPSDKDFTDTELALQVASRLGTEQITLFGGGGSMRMDHLIYFLKVFEIENPPRLWVFDTGLGFCFGSDTDVKKLYLKPPIKSTVSVFNINSKTVFNEPPCIKSKGLHWSLDKVDWKAGGASISNRSDTETIELTSYTGRFLVLTELY